MIVAVIHCKGQYVIYQERIKDSCCDSILPLMYRNVWRRYINKFLRKDFMLNTVAEFSRNYICSTST